MSSEIINNLFFKKTDFDQETLQKIVNETLFDADDGELFMEFCKTENLVFDNGNLKNASSNINHGFGFRSVLDERVNYAHSSDLSLDAIRRASKTISLNSEVKNNIIHPNRTNHHYYDNSDPLTEFSFKEKLNTIQEIDNFARSYEPSVKQVTTSLSGEHQVVNIIRCGDFSNFDIRPLVRLNISVLVEKNGRTERGSYGFGGRTSYGKFIKKESWQEATIKAITQALVNLESKNAPAGPMPVILGPGWPGVLLHEAVGHGLEGDFNRKKTSAFASLIGQKVAADGITIVDNGTIEHKRGSINIDDEGTPSQNTTLIENGILKGYMQDRMNARIMGKEPTGNGRRESFEHQPLPRMTNTYMLNGKYSQEEMIKKVDNGIFAVNFSGGQVDITSGKFVFSASEAYKIENGKIVHPVKGATIIGNGPEILKKVSMVGNDLALDDGIGTCGKAGQSVPVGVGQPSLLVDEITVGGTDI